MNTSTVPSLIPRAGNDAPKDSRKSMAIVSSWNESCGNASYTEALRREFAKIYNVQVIPLNLSLLQNPSPSVVKAGRRHIDEIASSLGGFDYVNIQFEGGLYGSSFREVYRNVAALMRASRNLVVTMHRVDVMPGSLLPKVAMTPLRSMRGLFVDYVLKRRQALLTEKVIVLARKLAQSKNVKIKVHTPRDAEYVKRVFGFEGVFHFPLTFLDPDVRRQVQQDVRPSLIRERYKLPEGSRVVGVFGFISAYKGYETVVKAMSLLPQDWYLFVVGGQHPQSIRPQVEVDPYLNKLINQVVALERERGALADHERVRFIGEVSDPDFLFFLRNMDAVVLPYIEVGQGMSGVFALAMEAGARLLCANNLAVLQARRYYGVTFSQFDIGNYIELAQKIKSGVSDFDRERETVYNKYNVKEDVENHIKLFQANAHANLV